MDTQQQGLNWGQIIISVVLAVIVSMILGTLVTLSYGFYVGFQTRGDSEQITQQLGQFTQSFTYIIISALITAAVIYWRARVLARKVTGSYMAHVLITGAATVLVGALIGLAAGGFSAAVLGGQVLAQLVLVALVGFLTNRQFQAGAATAA